MRDPRPADVLPAAVLLVAAEGDILLADMGAEAAAVAAISTLPLLVRRRFPVAAFLLVAAVAPALDQLAGAGFEDNVSASLFALLLASYSLAAHAPLRRSLPALGAALVCIMALEAWHGSLDDYLWVVFILAMPWLSGRGVRVYRTQAEELRLVTKRLEVERESSERLAAARERERMAFEVNDAIARAVGAMELQAGAAERSLERDPERARRALGLVQETGRGVVGELTSVLQILRAVPDPEPQVPAETGPAWRAAGLSRWRWWSPWVDAALALLLFGLGIAYVLDDALYAGVRVPVALLQVPAALAIAVRQRQPTLALAVGLATALAESLMLGDDSQSPAPIAAVLLATYSVAVQADLRRALWAFGLALVPLYAIDLFIGPQFDPDDLVLTPALLGIPWLSGRAVAAHRRQSEELQVLAGRLDRERKARARLAVLEERARIARDLHDSIAHGVGVMVLQAGAAEEVLATAPVRAREAIRTVRAIGRQALAELGQTLGLLEPDGGAREGSPCAGLGQLDTLLERVRRAGLPVELRVLGRPASLPAGVDGAAYRVIQEGLTNALKHAGTADTTVTIRYSSDGVRVEILDDGGAVLPAAAKAGHGLAGMRERVAELGGRVVAGRRPGAPGFAVSAFLPYDRAAT